MAAPTLDQARVEAFGERMVGVINSAAIALMASIGHRTGLFDTMSALPPSTSAQIAEAAGLNERYVREWLGAMVTGRIVEHDALSGTYILPPEHAAWLTRAAGPNNLATEAQNIPMLGMVEEQLVACFRQGGGVPYDAYGRFQQLMAESSAAVQDIALIDTTLPLVPGLVERLHAGIDVLDVGCGCGHAINLMARAFPRSRFTGFDFSEEGIAAGRAEADRLGLANAHFLRHDVTALAATGHYDLITAFDAIHDQAQPAQVLQGIAEALRSGGTFLMIDIAASSVVDENIDHPLGPYLYTISCMHCMTVSLAQGGSGLGAMWGEQTARRMLADAGFSKVTVQRVEADAINSYYIATKR
jgi:2-polyprenyl-3-methyl-5-hydroxy-6-metoxy-1,4-benzoquinol methylase